jgi:DNA-directed RNA polymerase subunit alpha
MLIKGGYMGVRWRDFQIPKNLTCEESTYNSTYGKFIAEPFERGFGITLGNSLRRVLLSSIQGSAVSSVKINGVTHEFSSIAGVMEDVTEIILNIKKLIIKLHTEGPKTIYIKANKKGEIKGKDIIADDTVEILNPDLHLLELTKDIDLDIKMEVTKGRGYVPAERNKKEGQPLGVIAIDSIFTPVRKVNFKVENTRVGQITDYERLILEIWTNGTTEPKEALLHASEILRRHIDIFANYGKPTEEIEVEEISPEEEELYEKLRTPVSELELSVRSSNCLREANIKTIADLVRKTEQDLLNYRNFGKKSLAEITAILEKMGLSLGMKVDRKRLKRK